MKSDLVFGPDTGFYCGYAYANVSANRASMERVNSYISANYDVSENVEVFVDAVVSNNESFGRLCAASCAWNNVSLESKKPIWRGCKWIFPMD